MDQKQYRLAYDIWRLNYNFVEADEDLAGFLNDRIRKGKRGWLKKARTALFYSGPEIAKRMKISRSAYQQLEKNEEQGRITIESLAAAAEAMDCELVYAIRPKTKKIFH